MSFDTVDVPSLLLGWPLEPRVPVARPFAGSRHGQRFSDIRGAIHYRRDGHLLTLAPTGAGKGVRVIIPNLLHYSGPVITVDPKGENFAITARYRKNVLGQRIFVLDPFNSVSDNILQNLGVERASLNPLDLLVGFKGHIEPQLTMLASMFAPDGEAQGEHGFWQQEALKLLSGVLGLAVHIAEKEKKPPIFQDMIDNLFKDDVVYHLAVMLDTYGNTLGKSSYRAITAFLQKADKEQSGVMSTVHSYLTPFLSDEINKHLNKSSIQPKMILEDGDYTIYIVIPPSKLISHSILLRIWIATLLNAIQERDERPLKRTLFLLDECAQLGRMEALTRAVTLLRGYGLQVWMFFQDLGQLIELYGLHGYGTVINNCEVFQAFGLTRRFAAFPVSEVIGKYKPEDLVQIDKTQQMLSISTESPKLLRLMNYITDPIFSGKFDKNPLFVNYKKENMGKMPLPLNSLRVHS